MRTSCGTLYTKGLTQEQVGEVFQDIYGEHYSKAGISRMLEPSRRYFAMALAVSGGILPARFHRLRTQKIHRKLNVEIEAFYVVLAVREDKRREVLGIFNKSTERTLGWSKMLAEQHVRKIGLVCADGLKDLKYVIRAIFPGTPLQRCMIHLKRNLLGGVRNGDKGDLAEDLRQVFRTGDRSYTVERACEQWQALCEKRRPNYRSFRRRAEDSTYKAYEL